MKLFNWRRPPAAPARALRDRAWQAFADEDFESAVQLFDEWTTAEPASAPAWFGYAWSKFRAAGELNLPGDELLAQFRSPAERSLQLNGVTGELEPGQLSGAHLLLGFADKFSGKHKTAMDHFRDAIRVAPKSPGSVQARFELAADSMEHGDVSTAETLLREALPLAPNDQKISDGLQLLESRRGRLRVRFQVIQLTLFMKMEHLEVLAGVDETLGDIAAREFPKHGLNSIGVRFIYSGDNALPSDLDSGNHERHETLRQLGIKDGDTIFCMALAGAATEESFDIRSIREHLEKKRPALAQREMQSVIEHAGRDMEAAEFEKVLATAQHLAKLFPDRAEVVALLDNVVEAIRRRDSGSASAPATCWSQPHGCASRTAQTAAAPAPPLEHLWEFGASPATLTTPVVQMGSVLVGSSDQNLYCLDITTGSERWKWQAKTVLEQAPAVSASALYVPDRECLTRLDLKKGQMIWQQKFARACSPALLEHAMFVATRDGLLCRLDSDTGKIVTTLDTASRNFHSVAVDGGRVVGLSDSCAVCADLALGRVLWKREGAFGETTPVLAWDAVYVGTQREGLWCLDGQTGRLRWIFGTDAPVKAAPAAAKGRLFFGDAGGRFGCLDAETGGLLWRPKEWLTNQIACSTAPVAADPFVYVLLDNGALYCLDMQSGHELWSGFAFETEAGFGALAASSDTVLATSRLGTLVCFGTRDLAAKAAVSTRKAASVPSRTNLLPLKANSSEAGHEDIKMLDFGRPTTLSSKENDSFLQAMYFMMNNRLDEAIAILQRLEHEHPDEGIVLYNLGNVYEWQGLVGESLTVWDHLLELDPGDAYAFSALGRLLRTHPGLIVDVFGEARHVEVAVSPKLSWVPGADAVLLQYIESASLACRIDASLIGALSSGPVWYWWQMVETDHGPVLRLYLEFNYQPYKIHTVMQPLNILEAQVDEWLNRFETQDSFTLLYFDDHGQFHFARQLSHPAGQGEDFGAFTSAH